MIGKAAAIILGGGVAAGVGSYGLNKFIPNSHGGNTENMEPGGAYGFLEGTFGGHNLALNLAAGIGGNWAGNKLRARGQFQRMKADRLWGKAGVVGQGNLVDEEMISKGWRQQRGRKRIGGSRRAWTQATEGGRSRVALGDEGSVMGKRYTEAIRNAPRTMRRKASGLRTSSMATLKTATRLKRVANLAAWAPIAFMAFDMIGSLSDMPAPDHAPMQRRSASLSGTFMDTSMAYTQRKRALQAMHNTQFSGRAGLGNEASLLHR